MTPISPSDLQAANQRAMFSDRLMPPPLKDNLMIPCLSVRHAAIVAVAATVALCLITPFAALARASTRRARGLRLAPLRATEREARR